MTPLGFLQTVWPATGIYCLMTPAKLRSGEIVQSHKVFPNIKQAAHYAESEKRNSNMFFSVFTLKEERIWNPKKLNKKTQTLGAYETRTQANSNECQAFFFDLDVGESTPRVPKYENQLAAIAGIKAFCKATGLPRPMLVSSGGGVHVYWLLTRALGAAEWRRYAKMLRQLATHHGLKVDPSRTTDTSSVLRVAGTFNLKQDGNPRPVRVLMEGTRVETEGFQQMLSDLTIQAGLDQVPELGRPLAGDEATAGLEGVENNVREIRSGPPVPLRAVAKICPQLRDILASRGNLSEPLWYAFLTFARHLENGAEVCHKFSALDESYDEAEVDQKLSNLESKGVGPTTCAKFCALSAKPELCETCPLWGKITSPISNARYHDVVPPPVLALKVGESVVETIQVPPPPPPYTVTPSGVMMEVVVSNGDNKHIKLCNEQLRPVRRISNSHYQTEQTEWSYIDKFKGEQRFALDSSVLYSERDFAAKMADYSIYVTLDRMKDLRGYMIAYIQELKQLAAASVQHNHLGWINDQTQFVLPDRLLTEAGEVKAVTLSKAAQTATREVKKAGTLAKQAELLNFYNRPEYLAHQFFLMCGLAAPIFYMTGHHGVVVHATGIAGASKSTALYTAGSFWGAPKTYILNGTEKGATALGLNERVNTLANLPVGIDEITKMPPAKAIDLVMSITQPGHRIRLDQRGVERGDNGSFKSTILLSTANNSLHSVLSQDNASGTAGSMRVVEINMPRTTCHTLMEANDYIEALVDNCGHLGEAFIQAVLKDKPATERRVRTLMGQIIAAANFTAGERFWAAVIASVVVAVEISNRIGILSFDPQALLDWALNILVPQMRGTVVEEYATPLSLLTDYLEMINGDIIVYSSPLNPKNNIPNVLRSPRGAMLGHYEVSTGSMWLLKKGFQDYCNKLGANYRNVIRELNTPTRDKSGQLVRIVVQERVRKTLGVGTDMAKAQSLCFLVNMNHPDLTEEKQTLQVVDNPNPTKTPPTGNLSVVK